MNDDSHPYSSTEIAVAMEKCAREPVHIPGAVQPFGALLCFDAALKKVLQISANIEAMLGIPLADCSCARPEQLLGQDLTRRLRQGFSHAEVLTGMTMSRMVAGHRRRFHVWAFRSGDNLVVELEPVAVNNRYRWLSSVNSWLEQIIRSGSEAAVRDTLTEAVRDITGYDRALLYVFDKQFNGHVLAEHRNNTLPSLIGQHFPASDIPQQVRALYERNQVRMIADATADPVPLVPALNPTSNDPLDLGSGNLRAVSPVHCVYLKNMEVRSALSVAIFDRDQLWGLLSCHNREPLLLSLPVRDSIAMLVQTAGQRLFLLNAERKGAYRLQVQNRRRLLAQGIQQQLGPKQLLKEHASGLLALMNAHGLAMIYQDEVINAGKTPDKKVQEALVDWLAEHCPGPEPWHTDSLTQSGFASAEALIDSCCGLLAMPLAIDNSSRGWLLFFRGEHVAEIKWAGKPDKVIEENANGDGPQLSPRHSFKVWREQVRGKSERWTTSQLSAVRDLGNDLAVFASAYEITRLNKMLEEERKALAQANRHLGELAYTDALTGIMNRYRIEGMVQKSLANAERYGHAFSLLLFDIDHFKRVNDNHGHDEGDRILKELVHTINQELREGDHLGRWGGEEFLVLIPGTDLEGALRFAERLREKTAGTDFGLPTPVTISIGVAQWRKGDTLKNLLVRADQGMYRAKGDGRNRVRTAEE